MVNVPFLVLTKIRVSTVRCLEWFSAQELSNVRPTTMFVLAMFTVHLLGTTLSVKAQWFVDRVQVYAPGMLLNASPSHASAL